MTWAERITLFSLLDAAALVTLFACWVWIGWRIENPRPDRPSVSVLMNAFRQSWLAEMVPRAPRIIDSQILAMMRQGTAFFASGAMLAIGGGLALIGNPTPLLGVASDLNIGDAPETVWEIKLILVLFCLAHAFMKFVWAHRLFGYCAILMGAVPNDPDAELAYPRAAQAAEISISAARAFNKAMRATYFALAATAWLLGPLPLIVASALTCAMLHRREFSSRARDALLQTPPDPAPNTQT